MYVYIKSEKELWTVGFYDNYNKWQPESDHADPKMAAERVHWLNGGKLQRAKKEDSFEVREIQVILNSMEKKDELASIRVNLVDKSTKWLGVNHKQLKAIQTVFKIFGD